MGSEPGANVSSATVGSIGASSDAPIKILFLSANPTDTTRLALDVEVREIMQRLRATPQAERFVLVQEWAVRVSDLQAALLRHRPQVVHFSGHGRSADAGAPGGIVVADEVDKAVSISGAALAELFSVVGGVRCVVLNACYSAELADALRQQVDCVVGMGRAIQDDASIAFSWAFYQGLGFGRSVDAAFELGKNQLRLAGLSEVNAPELFIHKGVTPTPTTAAAVVGADSRGGVLWARGFGMSGHGAGVAVDGDGNIVLTGSFSHTIDFGGNPLTPDVDSAFGAEIAFVAGFDGAGNHRWSRYLGGGDKSQACGVAVDGQGNVFVTGSFQGQLSFDPGHTLSITESQTGFLASFDAKGEYRWARAIDAGPYSCGTSVAVDPSGDVWVLGGDEQGLFLERCAGLDGRRSWGVRAPCPAGAQPKCVAVDPTTARAFVTGSFHHTLEFPGAPGAAGHLLTSSGTSTAFVAVFDASGACSWARAFGGYSQYGQGIAVSADGMVMTGSGDDVEIGAQLFDTRGHGAMYVGKLDGSGAVQWARVWASPSNQTQRFNASGWGIATDRQGNVLVVGTSDGDLDFGGGVRTSDDGEGSLLVTKLDSAGAVIWSRTFGKHTRGVAVTADPSGSPVIVGRSTAGRNWGLEKPVHGEIFLAKLAP